MRKKYLIVIIIVVFSVIAVISSEYYTAQPSFCGSCHIMEGYYQSWERSKHGEENIACVDCHYAPGEQMTLKAKFKGLGQLFTFLAEGGTEVRKDAKVSDLSCTTSKCHPTDGKGKEGEYLAKKISFAEYSKEDGSKTVISITHSEHYDKTKWIEGQELHCDTCHQHVSADKHFEVSKEICYLCHFKNTEFNQGRSKCVLCHEIPTKSLQKQKEASDADAKPITHQSLEEAKVPCQSCHYQLISGKGEIKEEGCLNCHDSPEMLKKTFYRKEMHQQHVAGQNANCFHCHKPIKHEEMEFLDPVRESCYICHPDHHKYQKLLLVGDKRKDISTEPSLMYGVKTNCIGCHAEEKIIKGESVLHGSAKACVACHTEKHADMAKEWKDKVIDELNYAKELEKEAIDAIEKSSGKVTKEKTDEALILLREGQANMQIVEFGGGVHNKKYAIALLDTAMNNFEDLIDLLEE